MGKLQEKFIRELVDEQKELLKTIENAEKEIPELEARLKIEKKFLEESKKDKEIDEDQIQISIEVLEDMIKMEKEKIENAKRRRQFLVKKAEIVKKPTWSF